MARMESLEEHTNSFLVRIWLESREIEGADPEWRGRIDHVQSGERAYFRSLDRMVGFIVDHLGDGRRASFLARGRAVLERLTRRVLSRRWATGNGEHRELRSDVKSLRE